MDRFFRWKKTKPTLAEETVGRDHAKSLWEKNASADSGKLTSGSANVGTSDALGEKSSATK